MEKRNVRIGTPCHLDWQKMTRVDGGRFCGDCKKVVRDLSGMTAADARALLREPPNEGLCVRYMYDRDGKILFADTPRLVPASLLARGKRAAAIAAAVAIPLATAACSSTFGDGPDRPGEVMGDMEAFDAGADDAPSFEDAGDAGDGASDATPGDPDAAGDAGDAQAEIDAGPDGSSSL